ncbi:MAG: N-acetylglucosamine kinase [Gaiellales bacterium]
MSKRAAVLAVDGGGSKTDVALVSAKGDVLGVARGPTCSHELVGLGGVVGALRPTVDAALRQAGIAADNGPVADVGAFALSGADLPSDDRRLLRVLRTAEWAGSELVANDTFAVLRAGTDRGWGIGVVCGSGINCTGVGPDGRTVRFPAVGEFPGAADGGGWIGEMGLGAAVRGRDGRGQRTVLERTVPAHFGVRRPWSVLEGIRNGLIARDRVVLELPPLVFAAAAEGDAVARSIIDALADEVVTMVVASLRRLRLLRAEVDVTLGGGVFRAEDPAFVTRIRAGVCETAPNARVAVLDGPPVIGAALLGLDHAGARDGAAARVRGQLTAARMQL